jgi:RNA recognition motif-containing protein
MILTKDNLHVLYFWETDYLYLLFFQMSSSLKCQVLVRNLSKRTTSKQLQQHASRYGSVIDCYLTESEGEGFLEFNDRTSVDVFMDKRPHSIDNNQIQCQRCLPPNESQKPVKRIFLRGTIQQLNDGRLSTYFDKYGKIVSCTIPKGKRNNTFTRFGYAFVAFDDEDAVDRIIQDKPHFLDDIELEVQKAEDLARNHRRSTSRSPSARSSRSSTRVILNNKRSKRESPSPPPPASVSIKRIRTNDEFSMRHLEEENRRLREHVMVSKHHFDEDTWKLRRELDEERRRYDQLKLEYDHLRRDFTRITSDLQQKTSARHVNGNNKRDLSSRH